MPDPRSPDSETILLRTAEQRGVLSREKVDEALLSRQTMTEADLARDLADFLFERGVVSREQRDELRTIQAETSPGSDATVRRDADPRLTPMTAGRGVAAPDTGPPGEPFGRYRLIDQLGRGGMGVVWKAWDSGLRRVVALKQILGGESRTAQQLERFLREARAAARLRHPNVVAVYDVGEIGGKNYLTADFIDGTSLDRRMRDGEVPTREALSLVKTVAEALQYAHDQGIAHRDIKPANILLDRSGKPYVTDFGLAKDASHGSGPSLTVSGDLLGTPSYMSPEQAMGRPDLQGPASDQFSLGVMLYELVTGVLPFRAPGMQELLNSITDSDPIPPTRVDKKIHADVETVILKAMEKDPAKRYPSMAELAADLGRILDAEPILARRPGLASRVVRKAVKHRTLSLVSVAALAVGAGLGLFAWKKHREGAEAKQTLAQAGAGQAVVRRWVALAPVLREMESTLFDPSLSEEEVRGKNRERWSRVEQFMRETPADSSSQAAMKSLAGWARWLAGYPEEGSAWIRAARALDPRSPYPPSLEAMGLLDEVLVRWTPDDVSIGDNEFRAPPFPPKDPRLEALGARLDQALEEIARAPVPDEGMAGDLQQALRAVQALRAGRAEEATRELDVLAGSPEISMYAAILHECRARALARVGAIRDAVGEWGLVLDRREALLGRFVHIGQVHAREAFDRLKKEHDAREGYLRAIRCFTESIGMKDDLPRAHVYRGILLCLWADLEEKYQGAWEDGYAKADEDFTRALGWPESAPSALFDRALAADQLAEALERHGKDPSGALDRAESDATAVLAGDAKDARALMILAQVDWRRAARAEGAARVDIRQRGLGRVREAIRIGPALPWYHALAGGILLDLAMLQEIDGGDAVEAYRGAISELDEAIRGDPTVEQPFLRRGNAWLQVGRAEAARGADPRPSWEKAIADERSAIAVDPYAGEPHGVFAGVLTELCRIGEAVQEYEIGVGLAKDNGWMKESLGPLKEGLDAYEKQGTRGWKRTLDIAATAYASGDGMAARVAYEIGIEEAGDAEEARGAVMEAHRDLGRLYAQLVEGRSSREGKPFVATEEERVRFRDRAFEHLQKAVELGWRDAKAAQEDADLKPLWEDARWEEFVRSVKGE